LVDIKEEKSKRGKRSRASGRKFENDVRKDMESRGWIICKWTNTVIFNDDGEGILSQAKSKYNPFLKRIISEGGGFPDYIAIRRLSPNKILEILKEEVKNED
jgi:hypothetical protein